MFSVCGLNLLLFYCCLVLLLFFPGVFYGFVGFHVFSMVVFNGCSMFFPGCFCMVLYAYVCMYLLALLFYFSFFLGGLLKQSELFRCEEYGLKNDSGSKQPLEPP